MKRETSSSPNALSANNSWEAGTWWGTAMRVHCCILIVSMLFADVLQAQQFMWQNDSLAEGQDGTVQAGFVNGDIGAAVLDMPFSLFPLQIKSVQVFWRSQADPTTQVMTHVHLYGSGGPDPGSPLFTGEGAVMTAGYMNEFSTLGLGWTLNQGPFTVGIEYVSDLEQRVSTSSGHLTTDADGCQPGKNLIYDTASGQWIDPCALGMSGDFVIRVVLESMGTGCFGDSDCDSHVDLGDFGAFQACFSGDGVTAVLECLPFDRDGDSDVDLTDYAALAGCLAGPGTICDPACATRAGGSAAAMPNGYPPALLDSAIDILRTTAVDGVLTTGLPGTFPGGATAPALRWTLIQIVIAVAIISIITVVFLGPCWSATCRSGQGLIFRVDAVNPDSTEQARINEGLDWLLYEANDWEADACSVWYDSHLARQSTASGTIKVNHWVDRRGIVATRFLPENRVAVHVDFVIGADFSPELLVLILFGEWQHLDDPGASERQLEVRLKAFRQRVGLTELHPEFQHGPSEPGD